MASPNIYAGGLNLAGTVFQNGPATLQHSGPTFLSGAVQWVDTISGNNANAGTLPELPVATLAQAVTNSSANGIIVIGEGSSETLTDPGATGTCQAIALAGLSIFGCGTGSSRPRYTCGDTSTMLGVTAAGVVIEGLYFPASTAVAVARVAFTGAGGHIRDCYFECGASDTNRALRLHTGGTNCQVDGCSFVVTASRPAIGLEVSGAVTDADIRDCTFSGGSYGWSDYALKVSAAATRLRYTNLTFTNRSDLGHTVTGTTYQIFGLDVGGTGNVLLTA